jgi:tRNA dimethylallyltransferase
MSAVGDRVGSLVIGVLGPTGVGKTAVAVHVARALGTRVISCDSMQVYAGLPVLTNQPCGPEEGPELHDLVGLVDPYSDCARPLVRRDIDEVGRALVVGGSGLYMRAALAPLDAPGPGDPVRRKWLEERAQSEGPGALHAELARLDPVAAESIDSRNIRRVVRALESVLTGGRSWSGRQDLWRPVYSHPTLIVGLTLDRVRLAEIIQVRTARMMEGGALDEVARFRRERGQERTRPGTPGICSAIGYADICRYLDGQQSLEETVQRVAAATRRYARRQMTWLRRLKDAVMIDIQDRGTAEIAQEILSLADRRSSAKES